MFRARAVMALAMISSLAGCGGLAGGAVPSGGDRAPQTLRAVPIQSPTPAPKHGDATLRAVPIQSPTPAPKHDDATLRAVPIQSPTPKP
jgi:hypothetical protein